MKEKIFRTIIIANNILAVFALVLVIFLFCWVKFNTTTVAQVDTTVVDIAINYRKDVQYLQENYDTDSTKMSEELLTLKVPSTFQEMHLDLVAAYNLKAQGNLDEANNKISKWLEKYHWLRSL